MGNSFVMAVSAAVGVLALISWDRMRSARRIQALSEKHRDLEAVVNKFMEESERITMQLSRMISRNSAGGEPTETESTAFRPRLELAGPKGNAVERRNLVLRLSEKGSSVPEIAERLMIPAGEVELILNLSQTRRASVRTSA